MGFRGQKLTDGWRLAVLAFLFIVCTVWLAKALHRVQVLNNVALTRYQMRQSIRRVQVPGARGRIYDRNGVCLADNRPSYCIAYYVEELRKPGKWTHTIDEVDADIDRLSGVLGLPREITRQTVDRHVRQSLPMPLLAWRDVDEEVVARWAEEVGSFPGVDIYVQPERNYPHNGIAAHVLGYVKRDKPKSLPGQKIHFYLPEMIGRSGIEQQYNDRMTGVCGGRLIRVDARGYKHSVWEGAPAADGGDIVTTLDIAVQTVLEKALAGGRGAGVVIDPRNGDVLALASAPGFNLNDFVPAPSHAFWNTLTGDEERPLFNRALQGTYAPGSTFKTVTALAALASGKITSGEVMHCSGVYTLGTMRLRCWNTYGHGEVAMRKAIEQSCNVYFCEIAHRTGYDAIRAVAESMGLGVVTGIDLPYEAAGLLPTDEWKRHHMREPWRPGDTCQIAIGQGMLLTTPLQMAVSTAVLASGGKLYRPRLVAGAPEGELIRDIALPRDMMNLVREGMHDVTTLGTGRRARIRGTEVAAKTGTAEYKSGGVLRKNTWMTAFAPVENPTVAIAMVVEDGMSGGYTVAPLVHDVLVAIFGEPPPDEGEAAVGGAAEEVVGD